MVTSVNQRGFREWLIQRISALVIGSYVIVVLAYLLAFPHMSYTSWLHLYANTWMRIYTIIALFSVLWHTWIGLWTVFTDYIKCARLRLVLEILLIVLLVFYMVWCLSILWV